ncbi:MAG: hypothetical protein LLF96_00955 [Eubacteriales bacterium]|nr:hypothetical protein [Eubacteriales bacterium]
MILQNNQKAESKRDDDPPKGDGYFIAETKGTMESLNLRLIEKSKIV